ncbi:hypothetical protein [Oscillibacter sp. 1-3]|uniref:hypothetical protein n=1 Tax=Oscillibacter sp. 1-3 TaxID=1235797 RepID=UPI001A98E028|nr:hypothetical protein [Oscillibacter sp. 1-3]
MARNINAERRKKIRRLGVLPLKQDPRGRGSYTLPREIQLSSAKFMASAMFEKCRNAQRREMFSPIKADFCRRADARQEHLTQSGGSRSTVWAF